MHILNFYVKSFSGISYPVWILSTVMFINRSGMMVIPFLTLYTTKELGFSVVQAGMITGSFGLGSLFGSWLGGWLSDRIGGYKVIFSGLILGGLAFMGLLFFKEYYSMLIAIFVVSSIVDTVRPGVFTSVSSYSKPENQTRSVSLIRMAINLGISIGPAIGGFVAYGLGYDWLFIIDGGTCILAGIFLLIALPEKKAISEPVPQKKMGNQSPYLDGIFLSFLFFNLINLVAFFQILSTVPLFLERVFALSEQQIGYFFTLNGLIIFIFEMPLVYLSEKRRKSIFWVTIGAAMIGIGHLCFNIPGHWFLPFIMYSLLIGFGEILNFPFSNAIALKRGTGRNMGQYMGLYTMMFSLSFIIAPILGTRILDNYGFNVLWWCIGFLNLISVLGFIYIRNKDYE